MLEEAIDADQVISPLDLSRKELHLAPGAPECHLLPLCWFHSYFTIPNFFFSLTEKPNDRFCILSKVAALEQSYYSLRISTTICFHIKRLACA